jgi:hypothetical protein
MSESKLTLTTFPWDLGGDGIVETAQTLLQDAGRAAGSILFLTVMARVAATRKLVPYTSVVATDGSAYPAGVLMSDDVTQAQTIAGDVTSLHLLVGGNKYLDEDLIVFDADGSLTLDTVVAIPIDGDKTIRTLLNEMGIFPTPSDNNQQIQPI